MNAKRRLVTVALALLVANAQADVCPQNDRDASPLHREAPAYPHGAAMFCVEGEVKVQFNVTPDGTIVDAEVVDSDPAGVFDREALATVYRWHYQPACRAGEPVLSDPVQVVLEFQMGDDLLESHSCPENVTAEIAATLAEIASWYALLAEWMMSRPGTAIPQILIPEVRDELTGDERRVLEFHRDAIQQFVEVSQELASFSLERNLVRLLDFERAADDRELRETQALLNTVSRDLLRHAEAELKVWEAIGAAYIDLAQETRYDSETRALLVHSFIGDPNHDLPLTEESYADHVGDLEALVQLLKDGDWEVSAGQVQFAQPARQRQFEALLDRIEQRNQRIAHSYQRSMTRFREYW